MRIGIDIDGLMFNFGFRYIFLLASLIIFIQIIMAYYLVYRKRKSNKFIIQKNEMLFFN